MTTALSFSVNPITTISDPRIAGVDPFSNKPFFAAKQLYVLPYNFPLILQLLGNVLDPAWETCTKDYIILSSERVTIPCYEQEHPVTLLADKVLWIPRTKHRLFSGTLEVVFVSTLKKQDDSFLTVYHYGFVDKKKAELEATRLASCPKEALRRRVRWETGVYLTNEKKQQSFGVAKGLFVLYNRLVLKMCDLIPQRQIGMLSNVDNFIRKIISNSSALGYVMQWACLACGNTFFAKNTTGQFCTRVLAFDGFIGSALQINNKAIPWPLSVFHSICMLGVIPYCLYFKLKGGQNFSQGNVQ